jgi:LmbE family N-acetylglucosaminyl deacetylase
MTRTIAALFAHPDDETYSIAGTIARYAAAGVTCHLYCATDGDAGRSSGIAVGSRAELGAVRRAELREAARVIGFHSVRLGGHPDGRLPETDADLLVGEAVDFLRSHRPQVVVTFGPEGAPNAHRDHRAISRAATAAFFLAGIPTAYPEQLADGAGPARAVHRADRLYYVTWEPPPADERNRVEGVPGTARVDVEDRHAVKREAFLLHATQRDHRESFERIAMTPHELFALAAGTPQPAPVVDDLFAGLRP